MTRPIGYLVDENHFKYKILNQALSYSVATALDNYYLQDVTFPNDEEAGLGKDATIIGVDTDGEYQLKSTPIAEYIYFNYTDSSTNAAGKEITNIKNVYYGPGTVIKPNFNLKDSKAQRIAGAIYTKTIIAGTNFVDATGTTSALLPLPENTSGMFALGASEQIEIREPIVVSFSPTTENLDSKKYLCLLRVGKQK